MNERSAGAQRGRSGRHARQRAPTQADVASAAGVSTASVSRVLNDSGPVRAEVRSRVETAMRALDYTPHEGARALATSRSMILGAVIPTLNNAIFAEGINAFERAARLRGHTLVLSVSNYDPELELEHVRRMVRRGVDGVLLVGNEHDELCHIALERSGTTHVCAWTHDANARAPNIGFSNRAAIATVVDHLVGLGHRRIGMLAGVTAGNDRAWDRLEGARERLAARGLSLMPEDVEEVPYTIRAAREAFSALLDRWGGKRPSALMCGNDVIALGVLLEARRQGIDVPNELSVTGFDNLPIASELDPAITTVDVPAERMGEHAAHALTDAIQAGTSIASHRLETELRIRTTTDRPSRCAGLEPL